LKETFQIPILIVKGSLKNKSACKFMKGTMMNKIEGEEGGIQAMKLPVFSTDATFLAFREQNTKLILHSIGS
jgi:hypothetical protein